MAIDQTGSARQALLDSVKRRGRQIRRRRTIVVGSSSVAGIVVIAGVAIGAHPQSRGVRVEVRSTSTVVPRTSVPTTCPQPPRTTSDPNLHPSGSARASFIAAVEQAVPPGYNLRSSDVAGTRFSEVITTDAGGSTIRASIGVLPAGWTFACDMRLGGQVPTHDPDVYLSARTPRSASQIFVALSANRELTVTSVDPGLHHSGAPHRASVATLIQIGNALKATLAPLREAGGGTRFIGVWYNHGLGMTIDAAGRASISWRTYNWCGPGQTPGPCDAFRGSDIIDGGHATAIFAANGSGRVIRSSAPAQLPVGPVTVRLDAKNHVLILHPSPMGPEQLCGPTATGINCG
jgi:hypothetical protein